MAKRVLVSVAEVSGDKHAAGMVRALKQLDPTVQVDALGGPALAAAGATIRHETVAGAAMTLHGVKRVFEMMRLLKWAKAFYRDPATRPDLQVCVDSSAINLHFARAAKEAGIPVLYYVAPQLWASREGRMKKLRRYVERLACIFPFEEMYFRSHGVEATFVGHPLFDELPADRFERSSAGTRFPDRPPVIGIVPGSRKSEVTANLPGLLHVARVIRAEFPAANFLIPTTGAVDATVRELIRITGFQPVPEASDRPNPQHGLETRDTSERIKQDAFDEFIPRCDLVLTKSGTSTVHVAAWGVPMIVVYHVHPLLWHLAGRWIVKTRKIAMVNILAGQVELVPEFIPFANPSRVAACAIDLLKHSEKLTAQRDALRNLIATLDKPGASMNVARMAMEMMGAPAHRRSNGADSSV